MDLFWYVGFGHIAFYAVAGLAWVVKTFVKGLKKEESVGWFDPFMKSK